MGARKDQAQAYFFVVGRLVAGVLHGDPDTQQRPNRRPSVGTAIGALLAVLVAAGFAIYGLLRPGGSDAWRNETASVILVRETGARYVLIGGQLRPVLNYASARLVLRNGAPITTVSRDSLSGVTVGAPIGIPGAPDSLPSVSRLHRGSWTVCARQVFEGTTERTSTTLVLEEIETPVLSDRQGLLVSTSDNTAYLVWQGQRYRLASAAVAVALGYATLTPMPVNAAWLNPVPAGPDLAFPAVAGRGAVGPVLGGRPGVVGMVYEMSNPALSQSDLYLLRGDGLALLSRTAAALVLGDPATKAAYGAASVRPISITPAELSAAGIRDRTSLVEGFPPTPPEAANDTGSELPCVRHRLGLGGTDIAVTMVPVDRTRSALRITGPATTTTTADEVVIPANTGVLVQNRVTPGAMYLVNELGVKYPIPDADALTALGYAGVVPVDVGSELLALLSTGPVLSLAAALLSQPQGS